MWVAGPQTRGTLSLVFSCAITLFLCVWTTVQVNIEPPEYNSNRTLVRLIPIKALKENKAFLNLLAKRWVRKLGWSCVALIFPEGVLAIAAYERKVASLLCIEVNKLISERPNVEEWDMSLGYYAIMGGFVIPKHDYNAVSARLKGRADGTKTATVTSDENLEITSVGRTTSSTSSPEPASKRNHHSVEEVDGDEEKQATVAGNKTDSSDDNQPLTLTPYGVLQLAKWQWSPASKDRSPQETTHDDNANLIAVTSAQVKDKSNASTITKILVLWQALWMIVQIIGRRAQYPGIPVTLLELHTCLHAFCAFAMYLMWWDKPVDIDLPTTVHLTHSQIIFLRNGQSKDEDKTNPWGEERKKTISSDEEKAVSSKEEKPISSEKTQAGHPHLFLTTRSGIGKLMYRRLVGHRSIRTNFFSAISGAYRRLWEGRRKFWRESLSISFVGLVFGGVHLAAWNSSFPTYAEQILWRISSTITASSWSVFVLSLWLSVFVAKRPEGKIVSKVCGIILGLGLLPVFLVRIYLLVESFASIRRLPAGSYRLHTWSNLWPHVG